MDGDADDVWYGYLLGQADLCFKDEDGVFVCGLLARQHTGDFWEAVIDLSANLLQEDRIHGGLVAGASAEECREVEVVGKTDGL